MLMQAQTHNADLPAEAVPPLLLCQEASELDLYGTVDAAYCSLDGFDYLPPEELPEVLHRLHLFVRPGGMLIVDIRDPASFAHARRRHVRRRDGRCPVPLAGGV
ncbi:MAG: class I SAM-dependent methyltransferase [Oscillospiraceae bacterium]